MNQDVQDCDLSQRIAIVCSSTREGATPSVVRIEASFGRGFAGLQIIGNSGQIIEDGKERVRMALERLGCGIPAKKLLVSFSPGDLKVDGNHFDLGIAIAVASLMRPKLPLIDPSRWIFAAEIGLGGELRAVPSAVGHGVAAMASGLDGVVVATENLPELRALEAVTADVGRKLVYKSFQNLQDVMNWLWLGDESIDVQLESVHEPPPLSGSERPASFDDMDLSADLMLAAETAAIGMHSVLLKGVPGCGKSMFAKRLVSLLPPLSAEEHLAALQIHSAHREKISGQILAGHPPYRAPHHFASGAAILGAGNQPGEVALASGGVLFLDEFPEFRRDVIEALREPLESGEVQVSRAQSKRVWNAKMMLVAAANNCPCGWRGSKRRKCECHEGRVTTYRQRLSGPILDRIDLHLNMPEREGSLAGILTQNRQAGQSIALGMKERVLKARHFAKERNLKFGCELNRDIPSQLLSTAVGWEGHQLDDFLRKLIPQHVSSRAIVRCLRVARSIADQRLEPFVGPADVRQAWQWQAHQSAVLRGELIH